MLQGLQARTVPAHAQVLAAVADRAPALAAAFLASCTWTTEPQPSLYWCPSVAALRIVTPPMPAPATGTGGDCCCLQWALCQSLTDSGFIVEEGSLLCTMCVSFQFNSMRRRASRQPIGSQRAARHQTAVVEAI